MTRDEFIDSLKRRIISTFLVEIIMKDVDLLLQAETRAAYEAGYQMKTYTAQIIPGDPNVTPLPPVDPGPPYREGCHCEADPEVEEAYRVGYQHGIIDGRSWSDL